MMSETPTKKIHEGRNVKRFREMLGIKQDALADELGDDWNQQKISLLEQKETIDDPILQQVAAALKIPAEAIQNFDEEQAVNIISNTFNSHDNASGMNVYPTFNINPVEKWFEAIEENKKLYERLLQAEREKLELIKALVKSDR
jgi:transcriptional regulator with XRE-family HTH domain